MKPRQQKKRWASRFSECKDCGDLIENSPAGPIKKRCIACTKKYRATYYKARGRQVYACSDLAARIDSHRGSQTFGDFARSLLEEALNERDK